MASNINSNRFSDYFSILVLPKSELQNTVFELIVIGTNYTYNKHSKH